MILGFRNRLALFLVVLLFGVQAATAASVYVFTRDALIEQGKVQLGLAATQFIRQLDERSARLADGVEVLSLDFALRTAIAERDRETTLSVLRNHGRRVGASRMLQISLDGTVETDTGHTEVMGMPFAYPALLAGAEEAGRDTAMADLDGQLYWLVVVPVRAPGTIGYIAVGVPVDGRLLEQIGALSALPKAIQLIGQSPDGTWRTYASNVQDADTMMSVTVGRAALPIETQVVTIAGMEKLVLATPLATVTGSPAVYALLEYSLSETLRPYRPIAVAFGLLLAMGLGVAVVGSILIARGVTRPLEALADTAGRIAKGEYFAAPCLEQRDELGQLSQALHSMANAIAEREDRIRFQAMHDATTGLCNRDGFERSVATEIAADRHEGAAVLLIGIQRLHEIVNSLGHDLGDRLMRHAAQVLTQEVRADSIAARVADADFAIWLRDCSPESALKKGRELVALFERPYQEGALSVDADAAVGVAHFPDHGREPGDLLRHADMALFRARRMDGRVAAYDPAVDAHRPERLSLMGELRDAIEGNELRLFYQPKLDVARGCIIGAEALVRWIHPSRGFVPPDLFIPLAEETGTIHRLTRWALDTGSRQAAAWAGRGLAMKVAINLSVRDLEDPDLLQRLQDLMVGLHLPPSRLILEVTESAIMGEPDSAIGVLRRICDSGVDLAIDDFGVGQSSLAYLRKLPVRELKIDKSFVMKLAENADDRIIVRSIVDLGHDLGYRVTAEGVEDAAALAYLGEVGCDTAQGYFIARPMPAEAFDRFLVDAAWGVERLETAA